MYRYTQVSTKRPQERRNTIINQTYGQSTGTIKAST